MSRPNRHVPQLTRRQVMRLAAAGALGASASGWIEALAADAAAHPSRRKSCILLWMSGGPSQTDTFDPKPGHANSGPFKPIADGGAGDAARPAPAQARQAGQGPRHHPLDELQGRGPRPGHLLPPDRLPAAWARSATRRSARWSPTSSTTSRPNCRGSSASRRSGRSTPAAFSSGFLGPKCAPLNVGERTSAAGAGRRELRRCGSRISTSRAGSAAREPTSGSS